MTLTEGESQREEKRARERETERESLHENAASVLCCVLGVLALPPQSVRQCLTAAHPRELRLCENSQSAVETEERKQVTTAGEWGNKHGLWSLGEGEEGQQHESSLHVHVRGHLGRYIGLFFSLRRS